MPWQWHTDAKGHRHYRRADVELGLEPATPDSELDPASLKKDALIEYAISQGVTDTTGTKAEILERLAALDA